MDNQLTFWDKTKFYTVVGVGFFADGWANNDIGLRKKSLLYNMK